MRTPLQEYRQAMAEAGIELTLAEAQELRARVFAVVRRILMESGRPCPNDDDAFQAWLCPDDMDFVVAAQVRAARGD